MKVGERNVCSMAGKIVDDWMLGLIETIDQLTVADSVRLYKVVLRSEGGHVLKMAELEMEAKKDLQELDEGWFEQGRYTLLVEGWFEQGRCTLLVEGGVHEGWFEQGRYTMLVEGGVHEGWFEQGRYTLLVECGVHEGWFEQGRYTLVVEGWSDQG